MEKARDKAFLWRVSGGQPIRAVSYRIADPITIPLSRFRLAMNKKSLFWWHGHTPVETHLNASFNGGKFKIEC
jgi:hypothetical protein